MSSIKKQLIASMVALLLVVGSLVYGTVAYFTDSVSATSGTFGSAGNVSCKLRDLTHIDGFAEESGNAPIRVYPGMSFEKTLSAVNTGSSSLYIRVSVAKRIELSEANQGKEAEIDESLVILHFNTENWEYRDGYYYYRQPLTASKITPTLIESVEFSAAMGNLYKESTFYLTVTMDAVQSLNNGAFAWEAEGWSTVSGGEGQ